MSTHSDLWGDLKIPGEGKIKVEIDPIYALEFSPDTIKDSASFNHSFYITRKVYDNFIHLINEYKIPERLINGLLYAYANMYSTSLLIPERAESIRIKLRAHRDKEKFFEEIQKKIDQKKLPTEIKILYNDSAITLSDPTIINSLLDNLYKRISTSEEQLMYPIKDYGDFQSLQKYYEGVFAYLLFHHLNFELKFDYLDHQANLKDIRLTDPEILKEYSKNKLYAFIGKLMHLSGLMEISDKMDDHEISNRIKKKLELVKEETIESLGMVFKPLYKVKKDDE